MNNPFDYEPDEVALAAAHDLQKQLPSKPSEGKMYGVLVAEHNGQIGYLAAYSGQITFNVQHPFVPAVFDYLQPDGYFKTHEAEISDINKQIAELKKAEKYQQLKEEIKKIEAARKAELDIAKKYLKEAKEKRDKRRAEGNISEEESEAMTRESQFMKAEVQRIKKAYNNKLELATQALEDLSLIHI